LEQVQGSLRQTLLMAKRRAVEESFRDEITRLTGATSNPEALASIALPPPETVLAGKKEFSLPTLPGAGESAEGN
jgi:hypothetical protein